MRLFRRFANELADRNKSFGINLLRERVRWETHFHYDEDEEYKFPNDHSPYIARRLAYKDFRLQQLIQFKKVEDEEPGEPCFITDQDMLINVEHHQRSEEPSIA